MKTLGRLVILIAVYMLSTLGYSQTHKKDSEEKLIDVPEWAFEDERTKIQKIEAKDTLAYNEYIQLSVSYAEIGGNKSKISAMADSAFRINPQKSCETFKTILESNNEWTLAQKHSRLINRKLKKYGCSAF